MKTQTRPRLHTLLASLLLSLVTTLPARAAESVPPLINYQGSLTDANGAPMAGVKTMEFNLYDAPTGGNLIWGPQIYATVPLIGGKFNVLLGATDSAGRPITGAFADKTRYLSITLEGKEILPRQQILSTPFAMQAQEATHAKEADHAEAADHALNADLASIAIQAKDSYPGSSLGNRIDNLENFVNRSRPAASGPHEPPGGPWGGWTGARWCPDRQYICGIELKVEGSQGNGDDTAANGLRFWCCSL